jgi:hypothetical protein
MHPHGQRRTRRAGQAAPVCKQNAADQPGRSRGNVAGVYSLPSRRIVTSLAAEVAGFPTARAAAGGRAVEWVRRSILLKPIYFLTSNYPCVTIVFNLSLSRNSPSEGRMLSKQSNKDIYV